ncbi:hypothetical protein BH09VER1_BH09VER1_28410 [soil metagenome]
MSPVLVKDTATPELNRIRGLVKRPKALMSAAGKRVEFVLRAHFLKKNQEGNRRGWTRSNFWNKRVRSATSFTGATDTTAQVTIASPEFIHKLRGGKITAKRGKFLSIPLPDRAKAAGSPREWDGPEKLVPRKTSDGYMLGVAQPGQAGNRGQRLTMMYLLVKSVNQKADPTALPPDAEIQTAIDQEANDYFNRELSRA